MTDLAEFKNIILVFYPLLKGVDEWSKKSVGKVTFWKSRKVHIWVKGMCLSVCLSVPNKHVNIFRITLNVAHIFSEKICPKFSCHLRP